MRAFTLFVRGIIGPRTFSWQGAAVFSVVTTVGTVALNDAVFRSHPLWLLAVILFAQVCALFVYAIAALVFVRIQSPGWQLTIFLASYVLVCVTRAFTIERLLWNYGLLADDQLFWRLRSNLILNIPSYFGAAWFINRYDNLRQRSVALHARSEHLQRELADLTLRYTEQRSYAERELSLEVASAKHILDELLSQSTLPPQHRAVVENISRQVQEASDLLREMSQSPIPSRTSLVMSDRETEMYRSLAAGHARLSSNIARLQELERQNADLHGVAQNMHVIMHREDVAWKNMFVGEIGQAPTAATVMLRAFVQDPETADAGQLLARVSSIWNRVIVELRAVTS